MTLPGFLFFYEILNPFNFKKYEKFPDSLV